MLTEYKVELTELVSKSWLQKKPTLSCHANNLLIALTSLLLEYKNNKFTKTKGDSPQHAAAQEKQQKKSKNLTKI